MTTLTTFNTFYNITGALTPVDVVNSVLGSHDYSENQVEAIQESYRLAVRGVAEKNNVILSGNDFLIHADDDRRNDTADMDNLCETLYEEIDAIDLIAMIDAAEALDA